MSAVCVCQWRSPKVTAGPFCHPKKQTHNAWGRLFMRLLFFHFKFPNTWLQSQWWQWLCHWHLDFWVRVSYPQRRQVLQEEVMGPGHIHGLGPAGFQALSFRSGSPSYLEVGGMSGRQGQPWLARGTAIPKQPEGLPSTRESKEGMTQGRAEGGWVQVEGVSRALSHHPHTPHFVGPSTAQPPSPPAPRWTKQVWSHCDFQVLTPLTMSWAKVP